MPGIDGWALLHELEADPETRDIPVIVVTMTDDDGNGNRYVRGAHTNWWAGIRAYTLHYDVRPKPPAPGATSSPAGALGS